MITRLLFQMRKSFILFVVSAFLLQNLVLAAGQHITEVAIETDAGTIVVELYPDQAPESVASFLAYVDEGLYTDAAFYRTVRKDNDHGSPVIEVIQGGVLDESHELLPVAHETTRDTGILHTDGILSLARGDPGSGGGAAFFICIGDQPALNFGGMRNPDGLGFAAFGKVIEGMDIVHEIHQMDASGASDSEYTKGQMLTDYVLIHKASRRTLAH